MTVLRILDYPDPRLKTVAPVVEDVHQPEIQQMIDDMLETLLKTPRCGGLAATQLDIAKPKRIFVFYDSNDSQSNPTCVVNPEIISTTGEVFEEEGCMSVYCEEVSAKLKRPQRTKIKCINRDGQAMELERDGYLAKLFVHECDHLNGKLYIDYLLPLKRRMVDKKVTKLRRQQATK
jgi:peptide deformylase